MQGSRKNGMIGMEKIIKSNKVGFRSVLEVRTGSKRSSFCQFRRLRGQTLLGLTFFRLFSSSSSCRIRTSLVVSSSFSRRSSSCCRKNIRRSYDQKHIRCVESPGHRSIASSAACTLVSNLQLSRG